MKDFFKGKNVLIGVCGAIACYKTLDIVSYFRKCGANLKVVMTKNATEFVSPLTFKTVGACQVYTDMFDYSDYDVKHISLKDFADFILIAPASANLIGKISSGIADDLLSTVVLGMKKKVFLVPSMNSDMYENPIFQRNLKILKDFGFYIMEPSEGHLACGYSGKGRFPEKDKIIEFLYEKLTENYELKDKKILITLGATREYIDGVRFISNPSSGKMGKAIIEALLEKGAKVLAVAGDVKVNLDYGENVEVYRVISADEMLEKVKKIIDESDIDAFISCAAVCDYKPEKISDKKIKKEESDLNEIKLYRTPDILKEISKNEKNMITVGFAAETDNLEENALKKLKNKNLDMLVLNDVSRKDIGFDSDFNEVVLFTPKEKVKVSKSSKKEIARKIVEKLSEML